tara:strand:+ start:26299 stop:26637 length:339 start_codon:yes stop_codon:yes gene_type:complete
MEIYKLVDFTRGWLIGDFEPSLIKTKDFEVGVLFHPKGEVWPAHYHKIADEYNVLLSGKMKICNEDLSEGDVFVIRKGEVADPEFYEDCKILTIKIPSVIGDKYILGEKDEL